MKRVITMILSNGFYSDPRVYKEAKYLVQKGFEVKIICWDREGIGEAIDELEGIKVYRFKHVSQYGSGPLKQLLAYLKFLKDLKKYIKRNSTDYIHFHDLDTALLSLIISKHKVKFVLDMHEQYDRIYNGLKRKLVMLLLTLVSKRMDKFIVVNKIQINDYKSLYKSKPVYILRNLPETQVFKKVKKTTSEKIRLSFIGSVRDEKSLETLIEAFKLDKLFHINIIGAGTAQKTLSQKFKDVENVTFVNGFNYEDIVNYYNQSDIIYAAYDPSNGNYRMAIPVKVYEALFCGLPVVVSKNTEVEEFVRELNFGIAVDYADARQLKTQILKLVENNKKGLNNLSLNAIKQKGKFTWENEVIVLDEIYHYKEIKTNNRMR